VAAMNKHYQSDQVIKELWVIKDSTASTYPNVGDYVSYLRQMTRSKMDHANKASTLRSTKPRRKAS
jgi:hypothetical protein